MQADYAKKICLNAEGKGRIELPGEKYVFEYESQVDLKNNKFDLVLDFPIKGQSLISLSLDPKLAKSTIARSNLLELFRERVKDRANREELVKALSAFFEMTAEFVAARSQNIFPEGFTATLENNHFKLLRLSPQFKFEVDSYAFNQKYFERTELKIFPNQGASAAPVMSLFLVPSNCSP